MMDAARTGTARRGANGAAGAPANGKDAPGRINQRRRTRADLLKAAARLMRDRGGMEGLTIDDVAAEAMVSRATVYRYFPSVEALLVEAPLDGAVPEPEALFAGDESTDAAARVDRAEAALHEMCYRNEAQLRRLLVNSLTAPTRGTDPGGQDGENEGGRRQNRRTPLIEAALAPARDQMDRRTYENLRAALALIFGTESMIVFRDVVPIRPAEARKVKSWAIKALVDAALKTPRK
jgi:AcrR family transcriptional regulator